MDDPKLHAGVYEQIINEYFQKALENLDSNIKTGKEKIDDQESSVRLAQYLSHVIRHALDLIGKSKSKIPKKIQICNHIIDMLANSVQDNELREKIIDDRAEILLYIIDDSKSTRSPTDILNNRPKTPISQSALFTGSDNEPSLVSELNKEIVNSDRIDILMSFIRWEGLRLLLPSIEKFTNRKNTHLRIITTPYLGVTSSKALRALYNLDNTKIKISYDTSRTSLHAKSYLFYRKTGFTTAYIGSSNISQKAITNGLEWNVKITEQDNPDLIKKFEKTFNSYWNNDEFQLIKGKEDLLKFEEASERGRIRGSDDNINVHVHFDIRPKWFQKEILEKLESERKNYGHYRNLIVAATGTGKTVMAALDYKRFWLSRKLDGSRRYPSLLFIAHRKEILKQSLATFRAVLQDYNFGDLWVGEHHPESDERRHVFMSIQMFNAREFQDSIKKDHYSYIVIDEFHHAAAASYQKLLNFFEPEIFLGLTATPERMDGKNVVELFDGRISAELRVFEAINEQLLSPFQYFIVSDVVDLSSLKWIRGGYKISDLEAVYVDNLERAARIITAVEKYIENLKEVIGLGFCCSIKHAHFMAQQFSDAGIPSMALDSTSSREQRNNAKSMLRQGDINFIFVVDLYNEGVDIKEINTILFLRPTESLTVFLQQLGRGLRLAEGKEWLTVLDFVGRSHKKYSFESKLRTLIGKTHNKLNEEIEEGFPNLPAGCYIQMERVAQKYILENIKNTTIDYKPNILRKLRNWKRTVDKPLNFGNFLDFYGIEPYIFYKRGYWSRLCVEAGLRSDFGDPHEKELGKALQRLELCNSRIFLRFIINLLRTCIKFEQSSQTYGDFLNQFTEHRRAWSNNDKLLYNMLYYTLWYHHADKIDSFESIDESFWVLVHENPTGVEEILQLAQYNENRISFVSKPIELAFECPLEIHCNYSTDQVLAALGYYTEDKKPRFSEGVKYIKEKNLDVFFIELNKQEKHYSPSTLYEDYPVSKRLFHWQSQSRTTPSSPTGKRYLSTNENHDHQVLIFVREYRKMHGTASPYIFLGIGSLVSYEGSKPISIVWHLNKEIPPHLLKYTR